MAGEGHQHWLDTLGTTEHLEHTDDVDYVRS